MNKTIQNFKLDSTFGPSAVFAGYALGIVGMVMVFFEPTGGILFVIGMFISFTHSGMLLDIKNQKFRNYTALFGILKIGPWQPLKYIQTIRVINRRASYTAVSRGMQSLKTYKQSFTVYLVEKNPRDRHAVKHFSTKDEAVKQAEELSLQLNIPIKQ